MAGYLLADRVAGAVTGVVSTLLGVLGTYGRAMVDRSTEVRAALADKVLGGWPRRVRELDDAVLLGAHPAAWGRGTRRVGGRLLASRPDRAGTRRPARRTRRALPRCPRRHASPWTRRWPGRPERPAVPAACYVLSTRYAIAVRARDVGDPKRAMEVFRELLLDSIRVLDEWTDRFGPNSSRVMAVRQIIAQLNAAE